MKKLYRISLAILSLFFMVPSAHAAYSLAELSQTVLGPEALIIELAYKACYVFGAGLIMMSLFQFHRHRQNPSETRLMQPIGLLIFGVIFILLPLITQLSTSTHPLGH